MSKKVYQWRFRDIVIPKKLKEYYRNVKLSNLESINIMRIGEDLVLSDGYVPLHTDGTVKGKDTVMLVLVADGGLSFNHEFCEMVIQSGDIIRFDGNKLHGLYQHNRIGSRFVAIVWDVPETLGCDDICFDFQKRLKELTKESNYENTAADYFLDYLHSNY